MMRDWKPVLQVSRDQVLLLVTSETGDVLKTRLPMPPRDPRALLMLLEGLSLWSGHVRDAFFAARSFADVADLNRQADEWVMTRAAERPWVEDRSRTRA